MNNGVVILQLLGVLWLTSNRPLNLSSSRRITCMLDVYFKTDTEEKSRLPS